MRDEVKPHWAARVARHTVEDGELLLRTVHKLEPKNNLNNYGISVRLSTPMKGVVRLRTTHLSGRRRRGPYFEVLPDSNLATSVTETDDAIVYEAGGLAVRVGKSPFSLEFHSERGLLTGSVRRAPAFHAAEAQLDALLVGVCGRSARARAALAPRNAARISR